MASAASNHSIWLRRLAWMTVLAVACLFCLPGGAVLFVLACEAAGLSLPPVLEGVLVLVAVWLATALMLSSWGFLRCLGWALAMVGYAILGNALSPERGLGVQLAWIGFFGASGVVLGLVGPRGNRVLPWVRRRRPGGPLEQEAGARRTPWPQLRLRSLLVLVTVVGMILGVFTRENWRRLQQRRVAAVVVAGGGSVRYAEPPSLPPAGLFRLDDLLRRKWLLGEWYGQQVIEVGLGQGVGDDEIPLLGLDTLPALLELDLSGSQVSDAGLACLKRLPRLRRVHLSPGITDAGLVHLKHLPELKFVGCGWSQVTDAGKAQLATVPGLRVHSWSSPETDARPEKVPNLPPGAKVKVY